MRGECDVCCVISDSLTPQEHQEKEELLKLRQAALKKV